MSFDNIVAPNAILNASLNDGHKLVSLLGKAGIPSVRLFANSMNTGPVASWMIPEVRAAVETNSLVSPDGDLTGLDPAKPVYLAALSPFDNDFHNVAQSWKILNEGSFNPAGAVQQMLASFGVRDAAGQLLTAFTADPAFVAWFKAAFGL